MATSAKPEAWDVEVDFVAIGSGIGGLAGAITAHDHGLSTLVLEKSELVGGVTAYSMGEVWVAANHLEERAGIDDSEESGLRYCEWLSVGFGDEEQIRNYIVNSPIALKYFEDQAGLRWRIIADFADYYWPQQEEALREGRYLEVEPFPASTLGEWQELTRTSPHVPAGFMHSDIFEQGGAANILNWNFDVLGERLEKDERCLGPGLAAAFLKAVLDRGIPVRLETPAIELITEEGRVIGVLAEHEGERIAIRSSKGVLIATGAYDGNVQLDHLFEHRDGLVSMVPPSVTGDGLVLGGSVGAKVGRVPTSLQLGFHIPGEEHEDVPLWRSSGVENGLPHGILVNRSGRRFGDESFYRSIGHAMLEIDGSNQTQPNVPCWFIFDSQYNAKYPLGTILPGQEYPEGLAIKADSIGELGEQLGIDPAALGAEIEKFNAYARAGVDEDFHRGEKAWSQFTCGDRAHEPNPCLGTLEEAPYYGIRLVPVGSGMASGGIVGNLNGQALGYDDKPIEGLYVAGNSMARFDNGAGIQSGMMNGRGMTFGYLAARHAAGDPSEALAAAPSIARPPA